MLVFLKTSDLGNLWWKRCCFSHWDAVKLFEMVIGVFSLVASSVLPSASPSSLEGWERDWEKSLVPPLGWQPAPGGRRKVSSPLCSPLCRANALEEQLKEQELRADQTLLEEIKKQRELLSKMEREKSIEIENLQARWGWGVAALLGPP